MRAAFLFGVIFGTTCFSLTQGELELVGFRLEDLGEDRRSYFSFIRLFGVSFGTTCLAESKSGDDIPACTTDLPACTLPFLGDSNNAHCCSEFWETSARDFLTCLGDFNLCSLLLFKLFFLIPCDCTLASWQPLLVLTFNNERLSPVPCDCTLASWQPPLALTFNNERLSPVVLRFGERTLSFPLLSDNWSVKVLYLLVSCR